MRYVHVASKQNDSAIDYNRSILSVNGLCLYSLIEGFRQNGFNTHTVDSVARSMQAYRDSYVEGVGGQLFADSGGYSIIVGDVHPREIGRMIQCYNVFLENDHDLFNKIFSLDIPFSKKFLSMNTKESILKLNQASMFSARDILVSNNAIRDKYYFVWHFKMQAQYDIWNHIYDDLGLNDIIVNRAIGGMVALRGITGIKFSPFIGIAYRCLMDYIDATRFENPFTLHYLGMYLPYDRFQMALLDALFHRYLPEGVRVETTYDSVNFSHTARMNKGLKFFLLDNRELQIFPSLLAAPAGIIDAVYGEKRLVDFVMSEIDRRNRGERLLNAGSFAPLNIYSNLQLDHYFAQVVEQYGIDDLLMKDHSLTRINYHMRQILDDLGGKVPDVFPAGMRTAIMKNLAITFQFHRWFADDRGRRKLEELMGENIRRIGFPGSLN